MSTPSFNKMGSKVRIRNWLISHFPSVGRNYVEIFCGNANVYFLAINTLDYSRWILNDKYSHSFLSALKEINIRLLPLEFTDEQLDNIRFKHCLNLTDVEKVIEYVVSFGGKGYKSGITVNGRNRYHRDKLILKVNCARELLRFAEVFDYDWEEIDYNQFSEDDFLYFDPPYCGTKVPYPNINHEKLILNTLPLLKCRWALSGYDNWLYRDLLEYKSKYTIYRNSEIKGAVNGRAQSVEEVLWTNF